MKPANRIEDGGRLTDADLRDMFLDKTWRRSGSRWTCTFKLSWDTANPRRFYICGAGIFERNPVHRWRYEASPSQLGELLEAIVFNQEEK